MTEPRRQHNTTQVIANMMPYRENKDGSRGEMLPNIASGEGVDIILETGRYDTRYSSSASSCMHAPFVSWMSNSNILRKPAIMQLPEATLRAPVVGAIRTCHAIIFAVASMFAVV